MLGNLDDLQKLRSSAHFQTYGELAVLKNNPYIVIEQYGDTACIREEEVTQKHIALAVNGLEKIRNAIHSGDYDIVILDEINVAIWFDLLNTSDVINLINQRPEHMEMVLNWRNAPSELIAAVRPCQ